MFVLLSLLSVLLLGSLFCDVFICLMCCLRSLNFFTYFQVVLLLFVCLPAGFKNGWNRFPEPFTVMSQPFPWNHTNSNPFSITWTQLPWWVQVLGQIDYVTTFLSLGGPQWLFKPVFFTDAWIVTIYIFIQYKETPMKVNSQPVNLSEDDLQVKPTDVELALQSCLVIGRDRSFFKGNLFGCPPESVRGYT